MSIEPLMSDINLSVLNSNRKSASECCQICFLSLDYDRFVYVEPCNHKFCENCLKSYIEFRISERKVYPIECPTYTCDNKDIDLMIINVIDDKLYYKYQLFRRNAILDTNPNTRWCPIPDCQGYDIRNTTDKLECRDCRYLYCANCGHEWHENSCKPTDPELLSYITQNQLKECPRCKVYIEKSFGCPSVVCKCGANLCMKCGNMIDEKHNMLKCVLGGKYSKIPWGFITILLFSYILHPFEIGIVIIFLVEMSEIANDPEKKLWRNRNFRIFFYFCLILFSPILSVIWIIALSVSLAIETASLMSKRFKIPQKLKKIGDISVRILMTMILSPIYVALISCLFISLNAFAPFIGLALIVLKLTHIN